MSDEIKLTNNIFIDDKVMFVDLEAIYVVDNEEDWEIWRGNSIAELCRDYKEFLRSWDR